ncbi:hypothetical protein KVT40_004844 [Elsinoe batatas]|uniref:Uncharacterized protein n=1 Tax=Elsinoe batatas TaxID=2601811 RepID=A0A8K0PF10_9PEZI|nr:hypothetical protein KVT40_004844 [Elsinoe batatas]
MPPNQADLDALDAAIDRMRKHIPEQPYIQSIPQDEPRWHHRSREHANAWRKDAPFDPDERSDLQYQTFYYQEHGRDLIHLAVHSPPIHHDQTPNSDAAKSLTATPKLGPKKKISLADYKNQKNGTPKSALEKEKAKPLPNGTHKKPEREEKRKPNNDRPKSPEREPPVDSPDPIRRRTAQKEESDRKSAPSNRNPRAETPPIDRGRKQDKEDKKSNFQLPAPMSPLAPQMPERLSPIGPTLPECLSPTLPANIVAELDRREERKRARSDASKSSSGQSGTVDSKHDSVRSVVEPTADGPKKRKRQDDEEQRPAKAVKAEVEKDSGVKVKPEQEDNTSGDNTSGPERTSRPSFIYIFKIPKARRQAIARLLRFPPRPSIRLPQDGDDRPARSGSKHPPQPADTQRRQPSRSPSPVRPTKTIQEHHKTPLQPPFQSPPLPSKQDTKLTTPSSKKPTSHSMTRIPSSDSHVPSPLAPTPTSTSSLAAPSSTHHPASRSTPLSSAWQSEHDRLINLGRTLKNTSMRLLQSPAKWEAEHGMLTAIESLCCFVLAFHAQDRAVQSYRPPSAGSSRAFRTWGSMNGLWGFVYGASARWPSLRGVVVGLGMVYLGRIYAWEERERRGEEKERDRDRERWAEGKEGKDGKGQGPEREKEKVLDALKGMEALRVKALDEAGRNLGIIAQGKGVGMREVRERWPVLWGKVMDGTGKRGEDKGVGEYEGEVVWPLTMQTGPVEGARTALEMVAGWKAERKWKGTLKLTKG